MSLIYISACVVAGLIICDDIALGHIHRVKGLVVLLVLVWSLAKVVYKLERKYK